MIFQPPALWTRSEGTLQFPRFSLKERHRRWQRVRSLMAARGIDCLLVPVATEPGLSSFNPLP